ncbi:nucleoside phosphorylase, partial [Candidatus Woesearchaeota archaeon]|nr:nucleoside phosphorylase [Candidatus Woesearchaeota archaeon]
LEPLIAAGRITIISVGTEGSLQPSQNIGDVVVCTKASRDEGTPYHYLPPSEFAEPSADLTKAIQDEIERRKISYETAPSWTTDAICRETEAEIKEYQARGIATVEMEAASLFALAEFRGVEAASIFVISDKLDSLEWVQNFDSDVTLDGIRQIFDIALGVLS